MFPGTYFPPVYFAPSYFALAGQAGIPDPGAYPNWRQTTVIAGGGSNDGAVHVVAGDDDQFTLKLIQGGLYVAANTLTIKVWPGDQQAPVPGAFSASYVDTVAGTIVVKIPGAATVGLTPGIYECMTEAAVGTGTRTVWRGELRVLDRPGSKIAPPVYCSYDDMLDIEDGIDGYRETSNDGTGFSSQRAYSWSIVNDTIVRRYRPTRGYTRRRGTTFNPISGYEVPDQGSPPTPDAIRSALLAGGLVLDGLERPTVARIAASLAVAFVLDRQADNPRLVNRAAMLRDQAMTELASYRAFIDMNADGVADVLIDTDCCFLGTFGATS